MVARKTNLTNAFETTLASEMTSVAGSMSLSDATGLVAPFYAVIEPDSVSQREYVYVSVLGGTAATVAERYLAGSASPSGLTHPAGSVVRMAAMAQHFEDLHDRLDETNAVVENQGDHGGLDGLADDDHGQYLNTARHAAADHESLIDHGAIGGLAGDDHTQYLNTTRHDVTARHLLGTAIATGVPTDSAPGDAAGEGSSTAAARADHRHGRESGFVGARVWHDTQYNLTLGVNEVLPWNREAFDTHGFHSTTVNNSRFTIPAGLGGIYRVSGHMFVGGDVAAVENDTVIRIHALWLNGDSVDWAYAMYVRPAPVGIVGSTGFIDLLMELAAGDYVEYIIQQSGITAEVAANNSTAAEPSPFGTFQIERLGSL